MKLKILFGAMSISGASLALACSSATTIFDPGIDGGSSGSSGSSGAATVSSPGSSALTLLGLAMMGAAFRARKLARKQA